MNSNTSSSGGDQAGVAQRAFQLMGRGWQSLTVPGRGQIRALDALRSTAILIVIATHTSTDFLLAGGHPSFLTRFPLVQGGWAGVDLFFVLSGFFIGMQLWKELLSTQSVGVLRFILRRGMRIWPLYFATFAVLWVALPAPVLPAWHDTLFLSNYLGESLVRGGWSLSTEEQFYITVPLLITVGARRNWPLARYRIALGGLLALVCTVRAVIWARHGAFFTQSAALEIELLHGPIHTHCDGLLVGLLLSSLWVDRTTKPLFSRTWLLALVPASAVLALALRFLHHAVFTYTGLAAVFGSLLVAGILPNQRWRAPLEGRAFFVIARLSFGMYLNYRYLLPISLALASPLHAHPVFQFAVAYALTVALAAVVGAGTFLLIEHPFLELRDRMLLRSVAVSNPGQDALTVHPADALSVHPAGTQALPSTEAVGTIAARNEHGGPSSPSGRASDA